MGSENELDALIVGAGFSGLHMLNKLRKEGFKTKIHEAGSGIGGTWYWNRYPGARVDTECDVYQLTQDDIWKGFEWTERFPGQQELEKYFEHVDRKLGLSVDIKFNTRVISAEFHNSRSQWLIKSVEGPDGIEISTWANHMVLCLGFASRRYTPTVKGLDSFKRTWYHTGLWPKSEVDFVGKRVAVIGTGCSGVQIIQEIGPAVGYLTVYQRTPNLALPMQQSFIHDQTKWKFPKPEDVEKIFAMVRTTAGGNTLETIKSNGMDHTPEERRANFEELYKQGGFAFWVANYQDLLVNPETNEAAYQFWCEKSRARINDPVKKDILAPLIPPHPFGTKRPSLEQRYYEVYNQNNVDIIDIQKSPIIEITENGIRTQEEGITEHDIIVFATGFDSYTGGILNIQIINGKGESIQEKWKEGTWTNLGISTADFPNMFFLYGPQAPTAFATGPICGEIQGDWVVDLIVKMREGNKTQIVGTKEAEINWKNTVNDLWNASLFPKAQSWYQGINIPGKPREVLNFTGGIPAYISALEQSARNNYEGFIMS